MLKSLAAALAAATALAAAPALSQTEDEMAEKVVNAPLPASLQVYGLPAKPAVIRDKEVLGGKALRVAVPGAKANPWEISLQTALTKPVKAGDRIALAFWAKVATPPEGATTVRIPAAQLQVNAAPYATLFAQPVEVTGKWEFHQVFGKADKDYAANQLAATLHLATGKQVVDFGPFFVMNLGQ